ncbi:MAG TPA: ABC transporter ATP-binding protein, partial [Actinophytocola sp.]|nr:ABC transporter ATP-binding protein [Actinophytocola sp.]
DIGELIAGHRLLSGPAELADGVAARMTTVDDSRTDRQATLLVRTGERPPALDPRWTARGVGLEELVLAYLRRPEAATLPRPMLASA